jgi:nitrite reductase/ring-hydroxylating ferredoxin subunit
VRLFVCSIDEVVEGELKSVVVEGLEIPLLVTRVDGEIIAGANQCPHEDVPLTRACIQKGTIVCRAHGYAFDLKSGQCTHDRTLHWRVYKTHIENDALYVQLL